MDRPGVVLLVLTACIYGVGSALFLSTLRVSWFVVAEPIVLAFLLSLPLWTVLYCLDWPASTSSDARAQANPVTLLLVALDLAGIALLWITPYRF